MRAEIIIAAVIVVTAVLGVRAMDGALDEIDSRERTAAAQTQAQAAFTAPAQRRFGREVRIAAARDRHFYVEAEINRRPAHFLIDTGASYVALRNSDAREAGVYTTPADYSYPVRTANGETHAAFITLDELEIEGIRIEDVKAFVLPDEQLSINLLGMSFLSRLESVEARAGEMVLKG
jgi:aspartyl protease family protein